MKPIKKLLLFVAIWPIAIAGAQGRSSDASAAPREKFLKQVDAALASRSPESIASLIDIPAWNAAGKPSPDRLELLLPKAPLRRARNLSHESVIYKDGAGRQWRLAMRYDSERSEWRIVPRDSPCPRGGTYAPSLPGRAPRPAPEAWTVLECWPLPK